MENYANLSIIIDPEAENRIRYNFLTEQAVVIARDEDGVRRGIADLERRDA